MRPSLSSSLYRAPKSKSLLNTGRMLVCLALVGLMSGCAWWANKDPEDIPAKLVEFEGSARVVPVWSTKVGPGGHEKGLRLEPWVGGTTSYAVNEDGDVTAVETDTGKILWKVETEHPISSGPDVADGMIAFGTLNGVVVALDQDTGSVLWEEQASSEILAAPAIADGLVVVRCVDGRVFGLDASNGVRRWIFDRGVPLLSLRGYSKPLVRAGSVIIGMDTGKLASLRLSDGSLLWEQTLAAAEGRTELDRIRDIDGQIALVGTDIYVAGYQGRLAAMALESGRLLWARDFSSSVGLTVSRNDLFITDHEGNVFGLDRRNGATSWKNDTLLRRSVTAPAVVGEYVVVGDYQGYAHWLSREDGALIARSQIDKKGIVAVPRSVGGRAIIRGQGGIVGLYEIRL